MKPLKVTSVTTMYINSMHLWRKAHPISNKSWQKSGRTEIDRSSMVSRSYCTVSNCSFQAFFFPFPSYQFSMVHALLSVSVGIFAIRKLRFCVGYSEKVSDMVRVKDMSALQFIIPTHSSQMRKQRSLIPLPFLMETTQTPIRWNHSSITQLFVLTTFPAIIFGLELC